MDATDKIQRIVTPSVEAMGYEIVRIFVSGKNNPTLQIMVERSDQVAMSVDDCADVSRAVSALLDVEDPLPGAYNLEVSSPGIDRPLTRPKDFDRFAGFEAKVECKSMLDGRKKFRGLLRGVKDQAVQLDMPEGSVAIPLDAVHSAKLVLTDALIAASR